MKMRKIFIVDKRFQYSFILRNLIILLFSFLIMFVGIKVWEKYQAKQGFLFRPPENREVVDWAKKNNISQNSVEFARYFVEKAEVYTVFQLIWKPFLIVIVINILIILLSSINHSNKIAGPISRLKKVLTSKINGEKVDPVSFRLNDDFHELAELINKLIEKDNKGQDKLI